MKSEENSWPSGYHMLAAWLTKVQYYGDEHNFAVQSVSPFRGDATANAALVTRVDGKQFLVAVAPHNQEPPEESGSNRTEDNHE